MPFFKLHAEQLCLSAGSEVSKGLAGCWLPLLVFLHKALACIKYKLFALNVNTHTHTHTLCKHYQSKTALKN